MGKAEFRSPIHKLFRTIKQELNCNQRDGADRDNCEENAEALTNAQYPQRLPNCTDVVWHKAMFPTLRTCDRHHSPIGPVDKALKERLGTDCFLFATPDLKDQRAVKTALFTNTIMAVCVDPETVVVSEDVEDWRHSHYRDPNVVAYYLSKLVTLRQYRERGLQYELPEVVIPGVVPDEHLLGGIDVIDGHRVPLQCTCEEM